MRALVLRRERRHARASQKTHQTACECYKKYLDGLGYVSRDNREMSVMSKSTLAEHLQTNRSRHAPLHRGGGGVAMACRVSFFDTAYAPVELADGATLSEHLDVENSPLLFGCRTGHLRHVPRRVSRATLPPPSDEEQELLDAARAGRCKRATGLPGRSDRRHLRRAASGGAADGARAIAPSGTSWPRADELRADDRPASQGARRVAGASSAAPTASRRRMRDRCMHRNAPLSKGTVRRRAAAVPLSRLGLRPTGNGRGRPRRGRRASTRASGAAPSPMTPSSRTATSTSRLDKDAPADITPYRMPHHGEPGWQTDAAGQSLPATT